MKDDYILYDLRRSCNLYLKLELGYDVKDAARLLGHSVTTNLKHYSLDEDQINIEKAYANNSLQHAARINPDVRKRYSRHLAKDGHDSKSGASPSWHRDDIDLKSDITVSSLAGGFGIMIQDEDDDDEILEA